jgi:hypothetical protein
MIQEGRDGCGFARFEGGEQGFRLAPEMIQIGTREEIGGQGRFSMLYAWIRKQAARRTCGV